MKQTALPPTADTVESVEIRRHTVYMSSRYIARPNGQVYKINITKKRKNKQKTAMSTLMVVVRFMMMMIVMVKIMMKFEFYMAVKISSMIFRAVTRCSLVGRYQYFRETRCLHQRGLRVTL